MDELGDPRDERARARATKKSDVNNFRCRSSWPSYKNRASAVRKEVPRTKIGGKIEYSFLYKYNFNTRRDDDDRPN